MSSHRHQNRKPAPGHSKLKGEYVTQAEFDAACRQGCSDPRCNIPAEEHWGMGIEPVCHATREVHAFYDSRSKFLEISCGVCDKPILRVKVAE